MMISEYSLIDTHTHTKTPVVKHACPKQTPGLTPGHDVHHRADTVTHTGPCHITSPCQFLDHVTQTVMF